MKSTLSESKKVKLIAALKEYRKKFFSKSIGDLDESGTRLMINSLLSDVLCYQSLEEIKTEYMIKGTYADYVVQTNGDRQFLVEVKALSLTLTDKHLRQAINYGANEGIEWAVLTNGRDVHLYKIIFAQPIESRLVLRMDLSNPDAFKETIEDIQYLHRDAVVKDGLTQLWKKFTATESRSLAAIMLSKDGISFIGKEIRQKFNSRIEDKDLIEAITKMLTEPVDLDGIKVAKATMKLKKKKDVTPEAPKIEKVTEQPKDNNL